jgi:hypothetical protein
VIEAWRKQKKIEIQNGLCRSENASTKTSAGAVKRMESHGGTRGWCRLVFPSSHQKLAKQLLNNGNKFFSPPQSPRFMDLHTGDFSQQLGAIQNKEIL